MSSFSELLATLVTSSQQIYGSRLISIVQFGSTVKGVPLKNDFDIDLFYVLSDYPEARVERFREFAKIEIALQPYLDEFAQGGKNLILSPILRIQSDAACFSPLYLDMTLQSKILFDSDNFFARLLDKTRQYISDSKSVRVQHGLRWVWNIAPELAKTKKTFDIGWN